MPQLQLPIFPVGTTAITSEIAFERREDQVVYFNGHLPVFTHGATDVASFRLFTTQLIVNGTASQGDIARAFGISTTTVKRCVKRFRERGAGAFFVAPLRRRGRMLTPERLVEAQMLLNQGERVPAISARLGILPTTLHKALDSGRLKESHRTVAPNEASRGDESAEVGFDEEPSDEDAPKDSPPGEPPSTAEPPGAAVNEESKSRTTGENAIASTKSERSEADSRGLFGVATLRSMDRVCAAVGLIAAAPLEFQTVDDVPMGGVLCALPALLALGLLSHTRETFALPNGFYPIESIFIALALLALARVRSLESLRYQAPGEWGKLIGLDRIPEVKTMREKLGLLCAEPGRAQRWSSALAKEWMAAAPEAAGTVYVDGHVRVYHGNLTKLPRRYVARDRLLLRGTTDYWANAMDGQPFFVVTQPVDPGLLTVLRETIVPRLKTDLPGQPSAAELDANPYLSRFTFVFDRAGYSPAFFEEMWKERIAIITYHKFPDAPWDDAEFATRRVRLVSGEEVDLDLAERGTRLGKTFWLREIRHRDSRGHQTSVLTTDYIRPLEHVAVAMFARWCQENFFKYMLEHFGLDRLIEYGTEPIPDTTTVVNPAWRKLDGQVRKLAGALAKDQAKFGALLMPPECTATEATQYEQQKGALLQAIQAHQGELVLLKEQRKAARKHVEIKDLPEEDRFSQLQADKKHLVDTIKMVAYRAETALVRLVAETLKRAEDDARAWIRGLFQSAVDLRPDLQAKTLTVRVHRQATAAQDITLEHVCEELTATETIYPGSQLRLVFAPVGSG
jgi:biotin operon repressor